MSRRHLRLTAIVTFTLLGPVGAGVLAAHTGHTHPGHTSPDAEVSAPGQVFVIEPTAAQVAKAFTTDVDTVTAERPVTVTELDAVATPALAQHLAAHPPTLTPAQAGGRQLLTVDAVTVHRGPPVTAMVLATVSLTGTRAAQPEVLLATTLTLVDTPAGWRVAKVTS